MKVATYSGLAVETPVAKKRHALHRDTPANRLTLRDAAIVELRRKGWTRQELAFAFDLSGSQVNRILAGVRAFRAAYVAVEREAA